MDNEMNSLHSGAECNESNTLDGAPQITLDNDPSENPDNDYMAYPASISADDPAGFEYENPNGQQMMYPVQDSNELLTDSTEDIIFVASADDEAIPSDLIHSAIRQASADIYNSGNPSGSNYMPEQLSFDDFDDTIEKSQRQRSGKSESRQRSKPAASQRSSTVKTKKPKKPKKRHSLARGLLNTLMVFGAVMGFLYLIFVYSGNTVITKLRNNYIQTAMATLSHKYLATALIPSDIIDDVLLMQYESDANAVGLTSNWGSVEVQALPSFDSVEQDTDTFEDAEGTTDTNGLAENEAAELDQGDSGESRTYSSAEEKVFFELFYELDYDSVQAYISANPEVLENGWGNIDINEAGLDDEGTSITTTHGDQVLAINAAQGVVLIRIWINSSRGLLAICKDTSRLSLCPASTLGTIGQTAGRICEANDGILGLTGSAFMDDGSGNGGQISGLAICSGYAYGSALGGSDKRLELRNDNKMYIVDSVSAVNGDTRDACEFRPALIIDGEVVVDENCGWTSPNPRACLGQTSRLETMMFVLEGRLTDSPGDSVVDIAYVLQDYGCVQALNLDGGTSAIMYYDGEYVTRCSNTALPGGRTLPTAWVYKRSY